MPQTFSLEPPRRRSSSASQIEGTNILHMPSILPEGITDSDDSIVLSDLVRTGEASRLRRRGAMRIDHNHPHHATAAGHILPGPSRRSSPSVMVVERSNWDSDSEPDSPWFANVWNADPHSSTFGRRHSRLSRRFGPYSGMSSGSPQQGARDEFSYTLVCGAEVLHCDSDEIEPFKPSVLPLFPPSPPTPSTRWKTTKKSTGCGSIVHLHAGPRHKFRFWTARSAAAEVVIPLDACYFDKKDAARFSRNACGCVNEGVGCAIWYVFNRVSDFWNYLTRLQRKSSRHAIHSMQVRNRGSFVPFAGEKALDSGSFQSSFITRRDTSSPFKVVIKQIDTTRLYLLRRCRHINSIVLFL